MRLLLALTGAVLLVAALATPAWAIRTVLAFGDSLTAGLGVDVENAYPALLEARMQREGYDYRVINAGVSGETSAGGLRRVAWALRVRPDVTIVALGANDGLRGLDVDALRANLTAIVERLRAAGVRVLLAGMRLPPNYGADYARRFAAVFPEVAHRERVPLMPFLLEGVGGVEALNQPDGIHPTAEGHRVIAAHVWPYLRPLLVKP